MPNDLCWLTFRRDTSCILGAIGQASFYWIGGAAGAQPGRSPVFSGEPGGMPSLIRDRRRRGEKLGCQVAVVVRDHAAATAI